MSYDNSQLCHVWAQQTKASGKTPNGNFSFEGTKLFSYTTEIARFVTPEIVIRTSQGYSATTRGKHQNQIWKALDRGVKVYYTAAHLRDFFWSNRTWQEQATALYQEQIIALDAAITLLKTARNNISDKIQSIQLEASDILIFTSEHGVLVDDPTENKLVSLRDDTQSYLLAAGIDLTAKLAKERINQDNKARLTQLKLEKQIQEESIEAAMWRNFRCARTYFTQLMLRVNGDIVETSHGARVPLGDARLVYRMLKTGKSILGCRLGEFTVVSVSDDIVKIGCHSIPRQEIEALALACEW